MSEVEGAGSAALAPVANGALATAGTVAAALALAAVHDDLDVRVVLIVLDETPVGIFTELGRHDAVDQCSLLIGPAKR